MFDVGNDSRENPFEERGNDAILTSTPRNPLEIPLGSVTSLKPKKIKEAINKLLQDT